MFVTCLCVYVCGCELMYVCIYVCTYAVYGMYVCMYVRTGGDSSGGSDDQQSGLPNLSHPGLFPNTAATQGIRERERSALSVHLTPTCLH